MRNFWGALAFFAASVALAASGGAFSSAFDAPRGSEGSRWQRADSGNSPRSGVGDAEEARKNPKTAAPKSGGSRWQAGGGNGAAAEKSGGAKSGGFFSAPPDSKGSRWQRGGGKPAGKAYLVCAFKLEGAVSKPQAEFVARAAAAASAKGADALIVDMNTPGGDLGSTLEIMETLSGFGGLTVCYVNPDAISAGSFIAIACDKIFFSPKGVMGAAEAVGAGGGDIQESMKRKVTSFIGAKVRAVEPSGNPRRAAVQRAMNDPDFELEIGGRIIKKRGELLTLTASEAAEEIGGAPLLSDGTEASLEAVAKKISGGAPFEMEIIERTWADSSAIFVSSIAPLLFGIAIFLVVMDLKGGGIGILAAVGFGIAVCAFLGMNMSGLAGYEGILIFAAGAALIALEAAFFPGALIPSVLGAAAILAAAVWMFGEIPSGEVGWEKWREAAATGIFAGITRLGISVCVAALCAAALGRYFERVPLFGRLVLKPCADGNADSRGAAGPARSGMRALQVGDVGVCLTDLSPSGRADFGGTIADVRADFGSIARGVKVEIVSKKDFNLTVKKYSGTK